MILTSDLVSSISVSGDRNPKFGEWMHLGMAECCIPFRVIIIVTTLFLEKLCMEHISYISWGRNLKFNVRMHLGVAECCILFLGHCVQRPCFQFNPIRSISRILLSPTKLEGYSFGVVHPSIHTFCQSGTISPYLFVRYDSFLVQMISTKDSRYPISLVNSTTWVIALVLV